MQGNMHELPTSFFYLKKKKMEAFLHKVEKPCPTVTPNGGRSKYNTKAGHLFSLTFL